MCIKYNECHYGGMYNVYVKMRKDFFFIIEIMHMNGVSIKKEKVKELKSHSHEGWHPRSTSTSSAGLGASHLVNGLR